MGNGSRGLQTQGDLLPVAVDPCCAAMLEQRIRASLKGARSLLKNVRRFLIMLQKNLALDLLNRAVLGGGCGRDVGRGFLILWLNI